MKSAVSSLVLGLACATGTAQTYEKLPTETARVESFSHSPDSGTSVLQSRIHGQVEGLCNFSRVEIQSVTYNVTAKHCMVGFPDGGYDIVAISNFTKFYQQKGYSEISYQALTGVPQARKLSSYSPSDIVGKEVSAVGCFPDSNQGRMVCYKITGKPFVTRDGFAVLVITEKDHDRILSYDSSHKRRAVHGMSGSPVFDSYGNLFGVLSMGTVQGGSLQRITGKSFIFIEPVRLSSRVITPKLHNTNN